MAVFNLQRQLRAASAVLCNGNLHPTARLGRIYQARRERLTRRRHSAQVHIIGRNSTARAMAVAIE